MSTDTLAPTEIASAPGYDPDALYEVLDGQPVELPPMSAFSVWIASLLAEHLAPFARAQGLGRVVTEALFDFGPAFRHKRRPDVAFVSFDRWPRDRRVPNTEAWAVVPELVIEVVSPTDHAEELIDKLAEYFRAGARSAWVVYPSQSLIHVYESLTSVRAFGPGDVLDGAPVLLDFRLSVADLFGPGAAPAHGEGAGPA